MSSPTILLTVEVVFWLSLGVIFYSYFGYGIVLWALRSLTPRARRHMAPPAPTDAECPNVAMLIAAYNEEDFICEKLADTAQLNYPPDKLTVYIITDGSTDRTTELARAYQQRAKFTLIVEHRDGRNGKQAAIDRVLPSVTAPFIIFTDANTYLNADAVRNIVRHYQDPAVAAVAGEKRIMRKAVDAAAGAGEGLYWRYESTLKRWDAEFHTVVGAAGELFSVRRALLPQVPAGVLVEDFYITMRLCEQGYRVAYAPDAYAEETSSANVAEEMKRKVRIAAGGLQAAGMLRSLLNPLPDWRLTFQYVGHRLLRWTAGPLLLPIVLLLNIWLAHHLGGVYDWLLAGQIIFYALAALGYFFESRAIRLKALFVPMYFTMMNLAVYRGIWRLLDNKQSVNWEKAKRAPIAATAASAQPEQELAHVEQ